jgi:hypothetical protein
MSVRFPQNDLVTDGLHGNPLRIHLGALTRLYTVSQNKVTIRVPVTPAKAGVQVVRKALKTLDSGVRRNDEGRRKSKPPIGNYFCETV